MTISEALDKLRAEQPDCHLAGFGDLGSRLILRSSSDTARPQEFLDRMGRQAARSFALSDRLGEQAAGDSAIVMTPEDMRVIVRAGAGSADFICCVCAPEAEAETVAEAARGVLHGEAMVQR